jgi:hypothetical protein
VDQPPDAEPSPEVNPKQSTARPPWAGPPSGTSKSTFVAPQGRQDAWKLTAAPPSQDRGGRAARRGRI